MVNCPIFGIVGGMLLLTDFLLRLKLVDYLGGPHYVFDKINFIAISYRRELFLK